MALLAGAVPLGLLLLVNLSLHGATIFAAGRQLSIWLLGPATLRAGRAPARAGRNNASRELLRRRDVRIIPRGHARVGGEKTGGCVKPNLVLLFTDRRQSPRDQLLNSVAALGFTMVDRLRLPPDCEKLLVLVRGTLRSEGLARPRFHLPCGTVRHTNGDEKYRVCLCENP